MSKEDFKTTTKSQIDRRLVRMDGTPLPTSQDQSHYPKGGSRQHGLTTDIRPHARCPHWTMSSMYETGGKEHMEGECASQAEGHAQEDFLVVGAIDPEA